MIPSRDWTLILAGCILLAPLPLAARQDQVKFRSLSLGLSQSSVNAIIEDRRGFMWFGTQDGLNRFDGYSFTVFRHNPSDSNSIQDNYVWSLAEDAGGDLWIGTLNNGLSRYAPERGTFTNFVHRPTDSTSLANNNVTALCRSRDGGILVGTWGGGLQKYDGAGNRFAQVPLESKRVQCMYIDRTGSLWVGTWDGLEIFDSTGARTARYVHRPEDAGSLSGDKIISLREDSEGTMWIGTFDAGLNRFDRTRGTFVHFRHSRDDPDSPGSDAIRCMALDLAGRLWIGMLDAGIDRLDPGTGIFSHYRSEPFDREGLSSDRIFSLYEDRTGALWVGTGDAGINFSDPLAHKFSHFKRDPSDPGSLSNGVVRAILKTSAGELWIGTFGGGLNRRLPGAHEFIHYAHEAGNHTSLGSNTVMALFEDSRHDIWIGTGDAGLDRFDRKTGGFRHFRHEPRNSNSISHDAVMAIAESRSGILWVGTTGGGADTFDMSAGTFRALTPAPGGTAVGNSVWAVHEDRSGVLWLGTWGEGLARFDPASGVITRSLHDRGNPASISNNTVWSIFEDQGGRLWLGTWGGGLDMLDPARGVFKAYTEAEGLPNNVVYGILPDGRGNLWLSTNKGISKFTPASGTFRNYDVLDGLQADEFNQGAFCRGKDGTLYFGGVNGVNAFQPDSLRDNPVPPPVVITGFQIFNRPVFPDAVPGPDGSISLSSSDNFFSFEFAALNYTAPEKNRYAYKLEGFDRDWVYCGTRRYVSYTRLSGGEYVFRVRGSNADGIWNEEGISLRLHIDPPFYMTWWFLFAAGAAGATGIYALYRFRLAKLLDLEKLRTRIASDLHDDIGSGLTRIAVLSDVALRQAESLDKTEDAGSSTGGSEHVRLSIEKVGTIARELVDAMSDVVWSIDPRHDSAGSLMQRVKVYALELCEAKGITLSFETLGERDASGFSPEIMRDLLLVAKESVTNIVRHSECSAARIRLVMKKKEVSLEVEDDGRGFLRTDVPSGNGLANMSARAIQAGGTFSVTSAPGKGTRLYLSLPLRE